MTSYSDDHYRLITYKNKGIFTFIELPYDVKMMVLNKCLEKNAGVYYLIQDFRNLKTKYGIEADEGAPVDYSDCDGAGDSYNPATIFVFYNKSAKTPKPGMGDGEQIPAGMKPSFLTLSKIDEWRKKLDDEWMGAPIYVDNHRWASAKHYLTGAKYKKGQPDVYLQYSLDSDSDLSKDMKILTAYKPLLPGEFGKKPVPVRVDADYELGRGETERETVLRAKFADNVDMRNLLILTYPALLAFKSKRGEPAIPDQLLMCLRKKLQTADNAGLQ
jgi:predicted NAD-dependent protein-ADP-ribosyltransferase YbiA (DUF1768 family)